jgi:hypothetical protein
LAADFDLWLRFAQHAELVACAVVLGGFSIHDGNRSRVHAAAYTTDIERAVQRLQPEDARERRRLAAWHARYLRARRVPGLKRLVRVMGSLMDITGPVVRRDFVKESFTLSHEPVFP